MMIEVTRVGQQQASATCATVAPFRCYFIERFEASKPRARQSPETEN